jgi:hypothetical protein
MLDFNIQHVLILAILICILYLLLNNTICNTICNTKCNIDGFSVGGRKNKFKKLKGCIGIEGNDITKRVKNKILGKGKIEKITIVIGNNEYIKIDNK